MLRCGLKICPYLILPSGYLSFVCYLERNHLIGSYFCTLTRSGSCYKHCQLTRLFSCVSCDLAKPNYLNQPEVQLFYNLLVCLRNLDKLNWSCSWHRWRSITWSCMDDRSHHRVLLHAFGFARRDSIFFGNYLNFYITSMATAALSFGYHIEN